MLQQIITIALGTFVGYALFTVVGLTILMQPKVTKWYLKKCQNSVNEAIEEACAELDL